MAIAAAIDMAQMGDEETLQALEEEIVRIGVLYQEAESIYRLVEKRQEILDKIAEFEVVFSPLLTSF